MSFFDPAFQLVVGLEGGYVCDPADPGGETKYGISKRAYPALDIANLTLDQAKAIYQRDYWNALELDSKPWATALMLFDCGVNQGVGYAGTLPDDASAIAVARALRYVANPNFGTFGKGWFNRLFSVFKSSQVTP